MMSSESNSTLTDLYQETPCSKIKTLKVCWTIYPSEAFFFTVLKGWPILLLFN